MQSAILSLRWHILDAYSKVRHLQVLVIHEAILSFYEYVKETDVENDPEADN